MLDICLLGTGGMMPLPYRWLTSMMMRYNGSSILVDCGEGTQIAMKKKGWSPNPIDVICFTHFHADHISGLPGMLLNMGNSDRTEPLLLVGPKGLSRVVSSLRVIAPELPFELKFLELEESVETHEICGLRMTAFKVNHSMTCYGYTFELDRAGRFDKDSAEKLGIPVKLWSILQKGESVTDDRGNTFTPEMVMGEARKGLKVTYCTDTRPAEVIKEKAFGSDLLILEGMYGEEEDEPKAKQKKHMMMQEAAQLAKEAEAQKLWLTHYSPAMNYPANYSDMVKSIFPESHICKDGKSITLKFKD